MDLFRVERYMGDDDQDRGSPDKEESRLRQLYLEIERRKRKLEETKASGLDETHAQTSSQRRKKTKKAKKQREPERAECSKRIDRDPEVTSKSRKGKRRSDGAENADETIAASSTDDVEVRKLKGVKDKEKYETSKSKESQAKQKRKGSPTDKAKRTELSKEPEKLESARNRRQKEYDKSELKGSTLGVTCEDDEDEVPPEYEVQNGGDLVEQQSVTGDEEVMLNPAGYTVIGGHKNEQQIQVKKVQRMLPEWLVKPTVVDADLNSKLLPVGQLTCLNKQLIAKLEQQNMTHLFPVQSAVIPVVLSHSFSAYQPRDLCVSAPTGSGKTLAYVLPIVHSLMGRVVCHLRALVLLPTKDLANQVRQVFDLFTQGTSLKVGLATGTKSFAKEQEMIAGQNFGGGTSQVDILVCTPGRLVDHITSTPHFTLQHLRFLVIDEADRLLDQSYHGWLGKVLKAAYNTEHEEDTRSLCCRLQTVRYPPSAQTASSMSSIQLPLQKLLFSATMTHSPEKLAPLQLYQPVLFMVTQSAAPANDDDAEGADDSLSWYSTPSGLTEYMTICNSGEKPLVVLHFLIQLKFQNVLCFTSSIESTHRLHLLLKLHGGITVAEYSSSLTTQQRRGILRDFRGGNLQLLICSDAMARGMDIDSVQYVISYDAPNYVKGYIHRVGRTARAGNKGTAFTLLHSEEAHHFKELIRKTGREKIAKFRVKDDDLHPLIPEYQESLGKLQEVLAQEHQRQSQSRGNEKVLRFLQQQIKDNLMNIEVDQN